MVAIERAAEVGAFARKPAWKDRPLAMRVSIETAGDGDLWEDTVRG